MNDNLRCNLDDSLICNFGDNEGYNLGDSLRCNLDDNEKSNFDEDVIYNLDNNRIGNLDDNLGNIAVGERAVIKELKATGGMRRRLLDIGFIENTIVQCLGRSPGGDPKAFLVRGAVIAIRSEDCKDIKIQRA